jgi:hypothetical protein
MTDNTGWRAVRNRPIAIRGDLFLIALKDGYIGIGHKDFFAGDYCPNQGCEFVDDREYFVYLEISDLCTDSTQNVVKECCLCEALAWMPLPKAPDHVI